MSRHTKPRADRAFGLFETVMAVLVWLAASASTDVFLTSCVSMLTTPSWGDAFMGGWSGAALLAIAGFWRSRADGALVLGRHHRRAE